MEGPTLILLIALSTQPAIRHRWDAVSVNNTWPRTNAHASCNTKSHIHMQDHTCKVNTSILGRDFNSEPQTSPQDWLMTRKDR